MLTIQLDGSEWFDEREGMFITTPPITLKLEHSLISLSKWEAIWGIPFIPRNNDPPKTIEQLKSYIECMIIGNPPPSIDQLWNLHGKEIEKYISDPHSATKIYRPPSKTRAKEPVTAESIYYWMVKFGIPIEFQRWHLNRLLTLIDYFNVKDNPQKLTLKETYERNRYLNDLRLAEAKKAADVKG